MTNIIISLVVSIVAAFLYDIIKKMYFSRETDTKLDSETYSKKYIHSIKHEFYIGFFLGIIFMTAPDTEYSFINITFDIFAYFSFFVALMGFMCLVDVVNSMSNKSSNNGTDNNADT